jgi:hypothetical protein
VPAARASPPLLIALAGGGVPLVIELLVTLGRREFGSDLLAGLSLATSAAACLRQGRCVERGQIEFHHLIPFADGGPTNAENVALRCRAHNGYETTLWSP